jgi:hypothetical protein
MLQQDAQYPYDPIHPHGGVVDVWLMDDQTIACDPLLTNAVIDSVDLACQYQNRRKPQLAKDTPHRLRFHRPVPTPPPHMEPSGDTATNKETTLNIPTDPFKTLVATHGGTDHGATYFNIILKVMFTSSPHSTTNRCQHPQAHLRQSHYSLVLLRLPARLAKRRYADYSRITMGNHVNYS